MKLIKDLGFETQNNWLKHFGLFECPICRVEFRANYNDIKRGRKKSCGCSTVLKPLESELSGLKIIQDIGVVNGRRRALFQCPHCPGSFSAIVADVKIGKSKLHCGCYKIVRPKKERPAAKTTRLSLVKSIAVEYRMDESDARKMLFMWSNMKRRCNSKSHPKYKDYGGRGISVCESWMNSFHVFVRDMGLKPTPQHSIDRIDNDGDYEPGNCHWATQKEQQNNKRSSNTI